MPAFSRQEMMRRIDALRGRLQQDNVAVALLHTADNVFYVTGVPLLSGWGRPLWAILPAEGRSALCGAAIQQENMHENSSFDEIVVYGDDENPVQASLRLCARLIARSNSGRLRIGLEEQLLPTGLLRALQGYFTEAEFVEIGPWLEDLRLVKSDEELRWLELAADLAKIGADAFLEAMQDNATELSVAGHAVAAANKAMGALCANGLTSSHAYAQFGKNTLVPHLHPTSRRLARGDVVSLNMFPVVWGYSAELVRTFVYGEPTAQLRKICRAVGEAQQAGIKAVKPGVAMAEIDEAIRETLRRHDLAKYVRHGSGHAGGIMIGAAGREEKGELRSYNMTRFQPNMSTSVEPGVYVPGVGGFRQSDMLIVTTSGARCVTDFPHEIGF